jgi:threonine dehydratase
MISRRDIAAMHAVIAPFLRVTPVIDIRLPGIRESVSLKLEFLQHSGSFKARGAFANLLGQTTPPALVTAASGGNHGAAVAFAAKALGIPARIFVHGKTSAEKKARIASHGAEVEQVGEAYEDARLAAAAYAQSAGAMDIHAYDSEPTLLGQGTIAREFEEQSPDLDTVMVAVGGGGLVGGIAGWYGGGIKVVGVETQGCNTLHAALAAGKPIGISPSGIAADSLGASTLGALSFPIAQAHVGESLLVSDEDVKRAQMLALALPRIATAWDPRS